MTCEGQVKRDVHRYFRGTGQKKNPGNRREPSASRPDLLRRFVLPTPASWPPALPRSGNGYPLRLNGCSQPEEMLAEVKAP